MQTETPKRPEMADPETIACAAKALMPKVAGWLDADMSDELHDILVTEWADDGYVFAKALERRMEVEPDCELVQILDDATHRQWEAHRNLCADWVRQNKVRTSIKAGDKVKFTLKSHLDPDGHVMIEEVVSIDHKHGTATLTWIVLAWERLEVVNNNILAFNMSSGQEMYFTEDTTPEWAAAYAYCRENNRLSWLLGKLHDGQVKQALKDLPMREGEVSVSCGDWAAMATSIA